MEGLPWRVVPKVPTLATKEHHGFPSPWHQSSFSCFFTINALPGPNLCKGPCLQNTFPSPAKPFNSFTDSTKSHRITAGVTNCPERACGKSRSCMQCIRPTTAWLGLCGHRSATSMAPSSFHEAQQDSFGSSHVGCLGG